MKTTSLIGILATTTILIFIAVNCDARTRTISTSSATRSDKKATVVAEEEDEEVTTPTKTTSVSEGGGRRSSSSGNVHSTGNVRTIKTVVPTEEKKIVHPAETSAKRTVNTESNGKVKIYKTTEKPTITTNTIETDTSTTSRRTVSSDYKPRGGTRVYKTAKDTGTGDDTSDAIVYNSGRRTEKFPATKSINREYHGTNRRLDETIGNVRDEGNVYTRSDRGRHISDETRSIHKPIGNVRHVEVRKSEHVIHNSDRWERPREYPNRYYYNWGGNWHKFPIARGHYPRYFYYWTDNSWCRVDRRVVYMSWERNDYYEDNHVFVSNTVYVPATTYSEPVEYGYSDFIIKGETEENLIVKTLTLTQDEAERVEWLLDEEIIQNMLASVAPDEENRNENSYEYETEEGLLLLTAPEELVLKIQTIIQDEKTFEKFYNGSGDLAVDVISAVSPVFLEKDYNEATRLGGLNADEIQKFLASLDRDYRLSGKKCWYNENIGTITVVDEEENLYRAWDYMNKFPYIPRELVN